ncbi:phage holin family protein [Paenibacillus polymyxa]|uniref:phage holin family protein n=1 Tax=Paenibacillus polymyxa TaxID=1406 RepID=UPI00037053EA|nr:phage holin family protein [Paenibacillus polymyxa]
MVHFIKETFYEDSSNEESFYITRIEENYVLESVGKFLFYTLGGSILTFLFGGWSEALTVLTFLVFLDYLSGLAAAYVEGRRNPNDKDKGWNSSKGFWGIFKKVFMFLTIALLYRVDIMLGLTGALSLMTSVTYFYIGNELISLVENYGRMGWYLPPQIKQAIRILKGKENEALKDDKED